MLLEHRSIHFTLLLSSLINLIGDEPVPVSTQLCKSLLQVPVSPEEASPIGLALEHALHSRLGSLILLVARGLCLRVAPPDRHTLTDRIESPTRLRMYA